MLCEAHQHCALSIHRTLHEAAADAVKKIFARGACVTAHRSQMSRLLESRDFIRGRECDLHVFLSRSPANFHQEGHSYTGMSGHAAVSDVAPQAAVVSR